MEGGGGVWEEKGRERGEVGVEKEEGRGGESGRRRKQGEGKWEEEGRGYETMIITCLCTLLHLCSLLLGCLVCFLSLLTPCQLH